MTVRDGILLVLAGICFWIAGCIIGLPFDAWPTLYLIMAWAVGLVLSVTGLLEIRRCQSLPDPLV